MAETSTFGSFIKNAPPPVKKKVLLVISMAILCVVAALSTILWIWNLHKGPTITEAVLETSKKLTSHEPVSFLHAYEIKDMSMALMNKKGTRNAYSQFTLIFDCPEDTCKNLMELNRAKVINAIFEVGSDFYVEDFESTLAVKGFQRFKDQITAKTAAFLGKHHPPLVVLKDWVMN